MSDVVTVSIIVGLWIHIKFDINWSLIVMLCMYIYLEMILVIGTRKMMLSCL